MTHATDEFTGRAAITAVLSRQEAALNASSTEAVMPLYAEGGVFMPPFGPSAVGKAALQQAYDAVFRTITLHVKFKIADWFRWRAEGHPANELGRNRQDQCGPVPVRNHEMSSGSGAQRSHNGRELDPATMFENGMNNMNSFDDAVSAVLTEYRNALSQSDANAIASLYTPDGVLMPQNSLSSAGINAVRAASAGMLDAIGLEIAFKIAEARQVAPEWGFARTNSTGTITIRATGGDVPEANQELFLFQKVGEAWKIARYCFSTTLPPQA